MRAPSTDTAPEATGRRFVRSVDTHSIRIYVDNNEGVHTDLLIEFAVDDIIPDTSGTWQAFH
jgi:hypothetical protein